MGSVTTVKLETCNNGDVANRNEKISATVELNNRWKTMKAVAIVAEPIRTGAIAATCSTVWNI